MSLFRELKRRNVFRVAAAYVVTAWLIAQVADVFLNNFGAPEWFVRTVLFLLIAGLPIALLFAWAYELTPEGVKRQQDVDEGAAPTKKAAPNLDRMIAIILALAIAVLLFDRFYLSQQVDSDLDSKSIAVLPFKDMSQAQDQRWFADGLAEEIYNSLTKTPDIAVSSRTSTLSHADQDLDVDEIAAQLGVAHILEGSVRRSGDRVRVTAQLVRADDGLTTWSESYDRDVSDVIAIQEDLAVQIATALKTTMDPAALAEMSRVGTESVEAYDLFLKGRVDFDRAYSERDPAYFASAYQYFEEARAVDPGFGEAHLGAAQYWYVQLSPIRVFSDMSNTSLLQSKQEFDKRINAAIANAATPTDEKLYRAMANLTDLKVRDSINLFVAYLEDRPQHLTINYSLMDAATMIADREIRERVAGIWYEQGLRDGQAASEFLSTSHEFWDAEELAEYTFQALEKYPQEASVRYQAHRALLWTGYTEEAAAIKPVWAGSGPAPDWTYLVDVRQACAEGRRDDAEELFGQLMELDEPSVVTQFLILLMLGREDEAYDVVRAVASEDVPYSLATFLGYGQFDVSQFPVLQQRLVEEGAERMLPIPVPYVCPPPT